MDQRKNTIVKGSIIDLNDDGQGVLKTDGAVVFVPNALKEETVEGVVIFTRSKFSIAKVTSIINPSPLRVTPPCPYFNSCGGCDIMHMNLDSENEFKTEKVKRAFKRNCGLDQKIEPCISLNEYRYRNKIALPVSANGEIGLYRKNSHSILKIDDCLITAEWNKELIEVINNFIKTCNISCYDESKKTGLLKHIVARKIDESILITLVINGDSLPHKENLIKLLQERFTSFGLNLNINKRHDNVILTDDFIHIFGIKELRANEFLITYPVSNGSFYQVNNEIKNAIYTRVLNLVDKNSTVIDAYSGAGLLSAILAKKAKAVYGVEIVKSATDNADTLKKENNLSNLTNINGDCAEIIPSLVKKINSKDLILTIDPPRKGVDKKVLQSILDSAPNKIIYISCNPDTLARDSKIILEGNKYKLTLVAPYNMFPKTSHVETLATFEKIKK